MFFFSGAGPLGRDRARAHSLSHRPAQKRHRARLALERLEHREVLSASTLWAIGGGTYDLAQTFLLHSNPAAKHTVYLDFDGHTTGNVQGTSWDNLTSPAWDLSGNGAAFTTTELQVIQKVWARVAEDFAPFNIDVTTQDPGVDALVKSGSTDDRWGIRVVITPDDTPAPGSGGVAYIGSFNFSNATPVYVFNTSEKSVAEAASHEVGHSLGLAHDGTSTLGYYGGQGSGVTSWGPIMGAAYSPNVTQWSKGEYANANNLEDDLSKITTQNGFTYLSDDVGNTQATATSLLAQGASQVGPVYGIVERNTDADYFSFWADAGAVSLLVNPAPLGPNLAVQAQLYDGAGNLLTTVNPAGAINAPVNFTLTAAGQYFLRVSGTGKGDPLTNGFSSYASLGNYRITGTVPAYTGGTPTNRPPVANADTATTVAGAPVTLNVLANDSDPDGDALTVTGVSNVTNGTAVLSGNSVIFTPAAGFTGVGTFTYDVSDGKGGTASATGSVTVNPGSSQQSFTNDTDVTISSTRTSTVTSTINVSGQSGTIQTVAVNLNLFHTYDSDLRITLIAPDGTRVILFNRHGGSGDNLLNTTFDNSAGTAISSGAAPFTGTYRPYQTLATLAGKNANGTWTLEIQDFDRRDGGRLDRWTLSLGLSAAGAPAAAAPSAGGALITSLLRREAPTAAQFYDQLSHGAPPSSWPRAPQVTDSLPGGVARASVRARRLLGAVNLDGARPEADLPQG
ncbi:MAG: Ig-like domain-containing protein [Gemmataceae bacterium]